jgi:hypothetical protein
MWMAGYVDGRPCGWRHPPPVRIRDERRRCRGFLVCVQAYKKASQPFNLRIVKSSTAFELPAPVCVCVCVMRIGGKMGAFEVRIGGKMGAFE